MRKYKYFGFIFIIVSILTLYYQNSYSCLKDTVSTYYIGPTELGDNDGSEWNNRASYLDQSFWNRINKKLEEQPVQILLAGGRYDGILDLTKIGHPRNRLYINANTNYKPVFSAAYVGDNKYVGNSIKLIGSRNIELHGIKFTGNASTWAVVCTHDRKNPECITRDIQFHYCSFTDLPNTKYGSLGLLDGTRNIIVRRCNFKNVGTEKTAHMIYNSNDTQKISIQECSFVDCPSDYVRFRNDTEFCEIYGSSFYNTRKDTSNSFINIAAINDVKPGDEFFGTHFKFNNNTFEYRFNEWNRNPIVFASNGFNPETYYCAITPDEESRLSGPNGGGNLTWKRTFLENNMGILSSKLRIYDNTYKNVKRNLSYSHGLVRANDTYVGELNGWNGHSDITKTAWSHGTYPEPPKINNSNFEARGLHSRRWFSWYDWNPTGTEIKDSRKNHTNNKVKWHKGLNETKNAVRLSNLDESLSFFNFIHNPQTNWEVDYLFMIGSDFTKTGIISNIDIIHDTIRDQKVSISIDNTGKIGMMNNLNFIPLEELGKIEFSVDNNSNYYYNDEGDVMNWYHIKIKGSYSSSQPYVDIQLSNSNEMTLSREALEKTYFYNGCKKGDKPDCISFNNTYTPIIIDEIQWK